MYAPASAHPLPLQAMDMFFAKHLSDTELSLWLQRERRLSAMARAQLPAAATDQRQKRSIREDTKGLPGASKRPRQEAMQLCEQKHNATPLCPRALMFTTCHFAHGCEDVVVMKVTLRTPPLQQASSLFLYCCKHL